MAQRFRIRIRWDSRFRLNCDAVRHLRARPVDRTEAHRGLGTLGRSIDDLSSRDCVDYLSYHDHMDHVPKLAPFPLLVGLNRRPIEISNTITAVSAIR